MFSNFFKSVTFSEDVRYEDSGLTFIIGANAGRIVSYQAPLVMNKFCIRFEINTKGLELRSFRVRVVNEQGFPITDTIAYLNLIDWSRPGIAVLSASNFIFPEFGVYYLQVSPMYSIDWMTLRELYVDQVQ